MENFEFKKDNIEEEFSSFMQKVDEIETIIKGMKSEDKVKQKIAIQKADYVLGKPDSDINIDEDQIYEKENRTVINKEAFLKEDNPETMSQQAFMRSVEQDAKRRTEERRQMKETSNRYKSEGIKAFRKNDYAKALCCFNEAINCIKDSCVLYTNRCLTYLKLGLPKRALEDAEKALRLNENSIKATIYKAEALHLLGEIDSSNDVIEEASKKFPKDIVFFKDVNRPKFKKHNKKKKSRIDLQQSLYKDVQKSWFEQK